MKNMISIKYEKQLVSNVLLIVLAVVMQSACSRQTASTDKLIGCNNGTHPVPIEQEFKFTGDLLFMRRDRSEILAFSGETHEFTSLFHMPSDELYDVAPLSQDGKALVLSRQDRNQVNTLSILLLPNHGSIEQKQVSLPMLKENPNKVYSWLPVDWANNNYLQGVLSEKGNTGDELWSPWLLNPYQPEWKTLSSISKDANQAQASGFSISPDFTRVLYVDMQYHLVLYDLIQNKTLWEYDDYDGVVPGLASPTLSDATWSKDGKLLALPVTSKDGKPTVLILDKDGKSVDSIGFDNHQHGFSWSEDSQLLSFYEDSCTIADCKDKPGPTIQIISAKDGLLSNACSLTENTIPTAGIINNRIVWSPDQQFLAYSSWSSDETMQDGIILQRLSDPKVRIIQVDTDKMILLGWSEYHWTSTNPSP